MRTPKDPGQRIPDEPVTAPATPPVTSAPSDTASVLERLKAAQPRSAATTTDSPEAVSAPGSAAGRSSSPSPGSARSPSGPPSKAGGRTEVGGTTPGKSATSTTAQERLRLASDSAGRAAVLTGRAVRRGSTATAQHVRSWDPDAVRQVVVTLCAVACILGSAAGVGAFGGPSIRDAAGGLFAPDAAFLAPSASAFSIWSVIYVGLVLYTAFQWLPSQRRSARQRRLGWTVAASMLLNLAWILSAQTGQVILSLVIIMLLFFTLLAAVRTLNHHPTQTRLEGASVDAPIGLYLGWVLVAASANAAAVLTAVGVDLFDLGGSTWAVIGIAGVLITAAVICSTDRGRLSVAIGTSWGLLWIGVERSLGQPFALGITIAAALAIFLLLITAGSRRHRVDHAYRRWLRAQEDSQREPLDLLDDDYEDSRS